MGVHPPPTPTVKEQRDALRKAFGLPPYNRCKQIFGMGKTLAGAAADIFLPGVGVAVDIVERFGEIRAAGKLRWQGFLVSLEDAKSG